MTAREDSVTEGVTGGAPGAQNGDRPRPRPRLNVHSNLHRFALTAMTVYAFGGWAIAAPGPPAAAALLLVGAVAAWRIGFVRLSETDDGQLLVRNIVTTRRIAPATIDRLMVADFRYESPRGRTRLVEVHRRPGGRWFALKRIQCSATVTLSTERARATSVALAAWADAHGIRCDVDPHQLVSGPGSVAAPSPEDRWDTLLTAGIRRLHRELRHAPGPHRTGDLMPSGPNPVGSAGPTELVTVVTAAYAEVETEARRIAARGRIDEADLHRLVLRARSARLVHRSAVASIEEVVTLHRMVSRGELVPTPSQARRYRELVDAELIALRLPPPRA